MKKANKQEFKEPNNADKIEKGNEIPISVQRQTLQIKAHFKAQLKRLNIKSEYRQTLELLT